MSNELIDLNGLTEYKTKSDLKYQGKLTAGNSISLNSGVISVNPTFSGDLISGSRSLSQNSVTSVGSVTLSPGLYYLRFTCQFASNANGYRTCAISTNTWSTTDIPGCYDQRRAVDGVTTQTAVNTILQVSASDYPNGRTYYFLAKSYTGLTTGITAYPRAYYLKF